MPRMSAATCSVGAPGMASLPHERPDAQSGSDDAGTRVPQARRHRWVTDEPEIPFRCIVLYEDERIIVIDKPHFVPTTPRGMWYRQSALIRLREH